MNFLRIFNFFQIFSCIIVVILIISFHQRLNKLQQKRAAAATISYDNNVVIGGGTTRWIPRDIKIDSPTEVVMMKVLECAVQEIGDQSRHTNSQKEMDPKKRTVDSVL